MLRGLVLTAPRRVGAVGAACPARSAAGPGAAQRRRLSPVWLTGNASDTRII